jgi:hypothetical protein
MYQLIYCLIIFSFILLSPPAESMQLKTKFTQAKIGDYIVTAQEKNNSLLFIRDLTADTLVLEEVTIPEEQLDLKTIDWHKWLADKAPGHTSWTLYEIDLKTGKLIESFSYSKKGWLYLDQAQQFFTQLLTLSLNKLSDQERRKIGPSPKSSEMDQRALWNPPLIISSKKISKPQFETWKSQWPEDGTPLGGCAIELYFSTQLPSFPFPYWIEIQSPHYAFKLRVVDSGSDLHSPFPGPVPHRPPQFLEATKKVSNGLRLSITAPAYQKKFQLFAIDLSLENHPPIPISCEALRKEGNDSIELTITETELQQRLLPNHRYKWALTPEDDGTLYAESVEIFLWNGVIDITPSN